MKKFLLVLSIFAYSIGVWADDAVTAQVSGSDIKIALNNSKDYVAFQMDVTLPSGVSASAINAVESRLSQTGQDNVIGGTKFIIASNVYDTSKNKLRIIAYNLNNSIITGNFGEDILNITLNSVISDPRVISIDNILFVTKDNLAAENFANVTGSSDVVTPINEVADQLSNDNIYNLQGIKLDKVTKGINIIRGKKILVK